MKKAAARFVFIFHIHVPCKQECWKGAGVGSLTYGAWTKPSVLAQAKVPLMDFRQNFSFSGKLQPLLSKGRLAFEHK